MHATVTSAHAAIVNEDASAKQIRELKEEIAALRAQLQSELRDSGYIMLTKSICRCRLGTLQRG